MVPAAASLHWADYLVFGLMLVISLGIGVYQAVRGRKTTSEYHLGSRQMGLLPVMMSLIVSYISTVTLIGYPAELFAFGIQYYWNAAGQVLGVLMAAFLCVPLFYPLKLTSITEYLWLRYESRTVQNIATFAIIFGSVTFLGSVFYGPAVSMNAVSGFPSWASILIIGAVSAIYTSIGGYKAVVYTDVFQCFVMFAGMVVVLVQAILAVGGFVKMWNLNKEWGRLEFFDFDPNPTKRINFWGAVFGNAFSVLAVYGYSQSGYQRYNSMPNIAKARWCLLGMVPGNVLMQTLAFMSGMAMFAYYADIGCDPKELGVISSYNQLMPYFVATIFSIPVMPGLFLAAVYAASLSSASTVMNSASAVLWRDVLQRLWPDCSEHAATTINKVVTVVAGVIGVSIAIGLDNMEGATLVQIMITFDAAASGPVFAMYFMGAFIPWVTWTGVAIGSVCGAAFGTWISLGSYFYGRNWQPLPSPVENCTAMFNASLLETTWTTAGYPAYGYDVTSSATILSDSSEPSGLNRLYSLSFLWMRETIAGVTVVISIIFSAMSGFRKANTVEEQFMHPVLRRCFHLKPNNYVPDDNSNIEMTPTQQGYILADVVRKSSNLSDRYRSQEL